MSHRKISAMIRARNLKRVRAREIAEFIEYGLLTMVMLGVLACGVMLALAQSGVA